MNNYPEKRKMRKSASPVVAPKNRTISSLFQQFLFSVQIVRFSDNEEDLLIRPSVAFNKMVGLSIVFYIYLCFRRIVFLSPDDHQVGKKDDRTAVRRIRILGVDRVSL